MFTAMGDTSNTTAVLVVFWELAAIFSRALKNSFIKVRLSSVTEDIDSKITVPFRLIFIKKMLFLSVGMREYKSGYIRIHLSYCQLKAK